MPHRCMFSSLPQFTIPLMPVNPARVGYVLNIQLHEIRPERYQMCVGMLECMSRRFPDADLPACVEQKMLGGQVAVCSAADFAESGVAICQVEIADQNTCDSVFETDSRARYESMPCMIKCLVVHQD